MEELEPTRVSRLQQQGQTAEPSDMTPHQEIADSLDFLEGAIDRLNNLAQRIEGSGEGNVEAGTTPKAVPSLHSVLHSTPTQIREQAGRIEQTIDRIIGSLFT